MLTAFDHALIRVENFAPSVRRYAALLGQSPWWMAENPAMGTSRAVFRLANTSLELVPADGAAPGLAAIAFTTDDADACAKALGERGIAAGEPESGIDRDEPSGAWRRWHELALPVADTRGTPILAVERSDPGPSPEPEPIPPASVAALDHVVVTTPDLEGSRALYGERLGLRLALDRAFEARGLRMLFFRIAGVTVEVVGSLAEPPDPEAPEAFGGLAYRVGDADAARARLAAADFDVSEVRQGFKPGTRVFTVRDGTCGVPTLLIEPAG